MTAAPRYTVQRYRADTHLCQLLGHRSVTELLRPEMQKEKDNNVFQPTHLILHHVFGESCAPDVVISRTGNFQEPDWM